MRGVGFVRMADYGERHSIEVIRRMGCENDG